MAIELEFGDFTIVLREASPTPNDWDEAGRSKEFLERFKKSKHWDSTGHDERCPWAWDYMDNFTDMNGHRGYSFPDPAPACHCERLEEEDDFKFLHSGA